jgi:hypothetical protein
MFATLQVPLVKCLESHCAEWAALRAAVLGHFRPTEEGQCRYSV